jgi:hypothetical protein
MWVMMDNRKEFEIESLRGEVTSGGRLTGKLTGQRTSDGRSYRFELVFNLAPPTQEAATGVACGS